MPDLYGYELFESCDLHDSYCFLLKKQFFLLLQAEKSVRVLFYRAFFPLCRKVWKMTFRKVPSAVGLILQLPTAHEGRWNYQNAIFQTLRQSGKNILYKQFAMNIQFRQYICF